MKRGAVTKSKSRLITLWCPINLMPLLDAAVMATDTDRSKFIRSAIREKAARAGITVKAAA